MSQSIFNAMSNHKITLIIKDGKIVESTIEALNEDVYIDAPREMGWPIKSVYPPPYTLDSYNIQNCMDDPALEHFFEEERKENEEES